MFLQENNIQALAFEQNTNSGHDESLLDHVFVLPLTPYSMFWYVICWNCSKQTLQHFTMQGSSASTSMTWLQPVQTSADSNKC